MLEEPSQQIGELGRRLGHVGGIHLLEPGKCRLELFDLCLVYLHVLDYRSWWSDKTTSTAAEKSATTRSAFPVGPSGPVTPVSTRIERQPGSW